MSLSGPCMVISVSRLIDSFGEYKVMHAQKNQLLWTRLRFALAGLAHGLSSERSIKTQSFLFAAVIVALIILRPAPMWWALLILAGAGVLAAELFNTAIERLADHLHPGPHSQIRIVKDCAAGSVLIMAAGALVVAVALGVQLVRQ